MTEEEWDTSTDFSKMFNFAKPTKRKCLLFVVACKIYVCKKLNDPGSADFIENDLKDAISDFSYSGRPIDKERIRHYAILYAIQFSERTLENLADYADPSLPPLEARQWQANLLRHMVRPFKE